MYPDDGLVVDTSYGIRITGIDIETASASEAYELLDADNSNDGE